MTLWATPQPEQVELIPDWVILPVRAPGGRAAGAAYALAQSGRLNAVVLNACR